MTKRPYSAITPPSQSCPNRIITERQMVQLLLDLSKSSQDEDFNVLELGCGQGEFRFLFQNLKYVGVDINDYNFAAKESNKVRFYVKNAGDIDFSNEFDLIFSHYAIHYFPTDVNYLEKMFSALKPNGHIIFSVPSAFVCIYEWPNLLFGLFGKRVWISSSGGAVYHSKHQWRDKLSRGSFVNIKEMGGCGVCVGLFKFFVICVRFTQLCFIFLQIPLAFILPGVFGCRNLLKKTRQHFSFFPMRTIGEAITYEDFLTIWRNHQENLTIGDRIYEKITLFMARLDQMLLPTLMIERIFIAERPSYMKE